MRRFARLYTELDATTRTSEKVAAMARYFRDAAPADAAWAVYFLSGARPKRLIPVRRLAAWAMEESETPSWLFEESYFAVGDLAETISLLLPAPGATTDRALHTWIEQSVLALSGASEDAQRRLVVDAWRELEDVERFLWNKLVTGELRVGVSRSLVVRALAQSSGVAEPVIAHRLSGAWEPSAQFFEKLVAAGDTTDADISRPYPFFLAYPLESGPETLGEAADWQIEWKWDGIRAQLIRRGGQTFLWSRGEESIADRFPEIAEAAALLPDGTVLDGEVMPWLAGKPLAFAQLQRRIGRKKLGPKILAEVPVVLVVYDLLEVDGEDVRERPLAERRARLDEILRAAGDARLIPSPIVAAARWREAHAAHARAREVAAEGLMLKRLDSAYGVGRRRGPWWKWKVSPYTVDAVLVYAQPGSGRRASLHTDYTFAVWSDGVLVPFAKAYSGLTDEEIRRVDAWVRRNTVEKFGPVRSVRPEHVFEIAFEGIRRSTRHKSGVAVRFPRILRWRDDKRPADADTIETLTALLQNA